MEQAASQTSPVVGRRAPDFTLPDQDDREVKLSGLNGKWVVLYFYPKDDTPGCSCQATEFTALLGQFSDMGAVVLGVSPDSPEMHRKFIEKYSLTLTLLSDPRKEVMRKYGAWVSSSLGAETYERVIRCTYLVDPRGAIRKHWPEVIPQGHAERVREELRRIKAAH
jgi:thioredoxin-dependent peroxiredoxin